MDSTWLIIAAFVGAIGLLYFLYYLYEHTAANIRCAYALERIAAALERKADKKEG